MRRVVSRILPSLLFVAFLANAAAAQGLQLDPDTGRPAFGFSTNQDEQPDTYKRLPYRDLAAEIRIEVAAGALYDFDSGKVPSSAADYMQQAANLIFEHAKGPVRIECRSDRMPPAVAQKLAERCALVIAQWLTVQEKLTSVKFNTIGTSVPPPAPANPKDPFAPASVSQSHIVIDFAKK